MLLSICIPTYQRVDYLIQNIDILINEAEKLQIEIIICDNDTKENLILQKKIIEYKSRNRYFTYIKNKENIGIDGNMIKVLKLAMGKYCLWLGDDDIINCNTLEKINTILNNNDYDLILMNTSWISEDLKTKGEKWLYKKTDIYHDLGTFCKDHIYHMPFGSIIVKKEYLDIVDIDKYFGTSHAYSGYIIEYLYTINNKRKINVLISEDIKVYLRRCTKTWSENSFKIFYDEIPKWFALLPNKIHTLNFIYKKYIKNLYSTKNIIINMDQIHNIRKYNLCYRLSWITKIKIRFLSIIYPLIKILSLK